MFGLHAWAFFYCHRVYAEIGSFIKAALSYLQWRLSFQNALLLARRVNRVRHQSADIQPLPFRL